MELSSLPVYPTATHEQDIPDGETCPCQDQLDPSLAELKATSPSRYFEESFDTFNPYYCADTEWLKTVPSCSFTAPKILTSTTPLASTASGASNVRLHAWADPNLKFLGFAGDFCEIFIAELSSSTTSDLCGWNSFAFPALTPNPSEHSRFCPSPSHASSAKDPNLKLTQRKRGRLHRYHSALETSANTITNGAGRSNCIPHKEVERKYRERLNTEMERLRRAVPILPQSNPADSMGAAKPSKVMVLAVAIEYIKELESQKDAAIREVERLGERV